MTAIRQTFRWCIQIRVPEDKTDSIRLAGPLTFIPELKNHGE
jgi:hypothetical protein